MSKTTQMPGSRRIGGQNQQGAGLIEVLVAVLVLAIGMLGLAALQVVTLKNSGSSNERTQAMLHVYGMGDLLRVNKSRLSEFNTGGSFECAESRDDGSVAADNADLNSWLAALERDVGPGACGLVNCPAGNTCTVSVQWNDELGSGGEAEQVVSAQIRM